jgi:hypothetical protein
MLIGAGTKACDERLKEADAVLSAALLDNVARD